MEEINELVEYSEFFVEFVDFTDDRHRYDGFDQEIDHLRKSNYQ